LPSRKFPHQHLTAIIQDRAGLIRAPRLCMNPHHTEMRSQLAFGSPPLTAFRAHRKMGFQRRIRLTAPPRAFDNLSNPIRANHLEPLILNRSS
jgi:hypothetical protein